MGLSATIASAVSSAFTSLGDLARTVTYQHRTTADENRYNASTGTVTDASTSISISAVLLRYKSSQIDQVAILATDQKLIFIASQITFEPSLNDYILIDGEIWDIVNKSKDPSGAIWILQIRKG